VKSVIDYTYEKIKVDELQDQCTFQQFVPPAHLGEENDQD
jgi:hypothetical protein